MLDLEKDYFLDVNFCLHYSDPVINSISFSTILELEDICAIQIHKPENTIVSIWVWPGIQIHGLQVKSENTIVVKDVCTFAW